MSKVCGSFPEYQKYFRGKKKRGEKMYISVPQVQKH